MNTLYAYLTFHIHSACSAHLSILDVIIHLSGEEYNLWMSSLNVVWVLVNIIQWKRLFEYRSFGRCGFICRTEVLIFVSTCQERSQSSHTVKGHDIFLMVEIYANPFFQNTVVFVLVWKDISIIQNTYNFSFLCIYSTCILQSRSQWTTSLVLDVYKQIIKFNIKLIPYFIFGHNNPLIAVTSFKTNIIVCIQHDIYFFLQY
jgi:hypothetical protein